MADSFACFGFGNNRPSLHWTVHPKKRHGIPNPERIQITQPRGAPAPTLGTTKQKSVNPEGIQSKTEELQNQATYTS
jgi:hypothetical protein